MWRRWRGVILRSDGGGEIVWSPSFWNFVIERKRSIAIVEDAKFLLKDLSWTQKKCIRLLCLLFERDGWTVFSNAAQRYLRALLYTPWDNKMLEDVHNYLRDLYRQGRANLNSPMSRSNAAIHSKRIEERSITTVHPDRQYFRMHFEL